MTETGPSRSKAGSDGGTDDAAREPFVALVGASRSGDVTAREALFEHVYPELRSLAASMFASQQRGHTLQPTALVHEAFLKLAGRLDAIDDQRHFLVVAGMAMRQVITDHARSRTADKRGGGRRRLTLDLQLAANDPQALDLVALDEALSELARLNPRHAKVAELRLFSGLSIDEAAEVLDVSPRTVDADWALTKAWLRRRLG